MICLEVEGGDLPQLAGERLGLLLGRECLQEGKAVGRPGLDQLGPRQQSPAPEQKVVMFPWSQRGTHLRDPSVT